MSTYEEHCEAMIEKAVEELDAKLNTLGDGVRKAMVLPACKRHNLGFSVCNGDFWFHGMRRGKRVRIATDYETEEHGLSKSLDPIFAVLNLPAYGNQVLGYYVEAVPEPAPRTRKKTT